MKEQTIHWNIQGVLNIMGDTHERISDPPYVEKNLLTWFHTNKTDKIILWYVAVHNDTPGGDRFRIPSTVEAFVLETTKEYYIIDIYCSGISKYVKDRPNWDALRDETPVKQQKEGEDWFDKFDARWEILESPGSLTKLDLLTLQQQIEKLLKA